MSWGQALGLRGGLEGGGLLGLDQDTLLDLGGEPEGSQRSGPERTHHRPADRPINHSDSGFAILKVPVQS